jgi:CRP-like cAMP-binding protein
MSGSSYNRVASTVATLSERAKANLGPYDKIDFPLTHKLIASLTGLTRETVTLHMLKLEKQGLINYERRKVTVVDKEGLRRASGIEKK